MVLRGSCPMRVIALGVVVLRGSCLRGSCPQGSCPRGCCPRGSCPFTNMVISCYMASRPFGICKICQGTGDPGTAHSSQSESSMD